MTKVLCDLNLNTWMFDVPTWARIGLKNKYPAIDFTYSDSPSCEQICSADIYWGNRFPLHGFTSISSSSLKWIHFGSVGVDRFLNSDYPYRNTIVTSSQGTNDDGFVTHSLHLVFTLLRGCYSIHQGMTAHNWSREFLDDKLEGITNIQGLKILIVGMGRLSTKLASALSLLGADIDGCRLNTSKPAQHPFSRQYNIIQLTQIANAYDMIISVLPAMPSLNNIFDHQFFQSLSNSFFINMGRGSHVDEIALSRALNGNLKAAALDVVKNEPFSQRHLLYNQRNLYITPHVGGYDSNYWQQETELFARNLDLFLNDSHSNLVNRVYF